MYLYIIAIVKTEFKDHITDAGRCLVTFIPQYAGTYMIDVTFNGKQVHGLPVLNLKAIDKYIENIINPPRLTDA